MKGVCKLCGREADLQLGHIFPRFAVKWLKNTSATGFLRDLTSANRRQETTREYFLCSDCEQLLSRDERMFAEQIFVAYHERRESVFKYGPWLRRFLAGLHWKVLVNRELDAPYPENIDKIYFEVEIELRNFLLEHSESPGRAEFHVMFVDVLKDASHEVPTKANWYMARALDATPTFSDSGNAGIYAKLLKILTYSFLTKRDPEDEQWEGTLVLKEGEFRTPQTMNTASMGPFLIERMKAVEAAPPSLTPRQLEKVVRQAQTEPDRFLASESFRVHQADRELQRALRERSLSKTQFRKLMKGRDRNQPCPCGSPRKFKNCCGRSYEPA
jgi:hypothetical protein